ncbi:hypothetical protein EPN95_03835 [Patescibacteria group bacterium]|nr:MAG: hypothetical protein EPN95_03835 [Patescibacteria group bacterium]
MTNPDAMAPELLALPSDALTVKQYQEKLTILNDTVGAIPHSTRELNMMAALAHPIYQEDGVADYVDEVVQVQSDETPLELAEQIVGFYRDALMNIRDVSKLIEQMDEIGHIELDHPAVLAAVRRHEDTMLFMMMPEVLNLYIDDDYTQMDNAAYGQLLMANEDTSHVQAAFEAVVAAERDRAAFWLSQITGFDKEVDGERVVRKGLVDSSDPDVQAYIAQIAGIEQPVTEQDESADIIFSIGKRPKIGDTRAWEKFLHRNRLNDALQLHGFLPQSNKEAYKIKQFDRLKNDPAEILKWMDMTNESNRRWEAPKGKVANPKQRLDELVGRFIEYANDADGNNESADFVLGAIDEKTDETTLFKDSFPPNEWFRDYPDQLEPFTKLVEFLQTEDFIQSGRVDNITKKARAKQTPTQEQLIDAVMERLGDLPLTKVAEIADRYKMDQTNRYAYWKQIIEATRKHSMTVSIADRALSQLSGVGPRYVAPDDPSTVIHPTMTDEQPF